MCVAPLTLKRNRDEWQTESNGHSTVTRVVPCGKCFQCLARRRNGWSFRLHHQMNISSSACFMTLTYGHAQDDKGRLFGEDPPLTDNGLYTLDKTDLQKFLKRFRKFEKTRNKNGNTIKYYAVGEYGTKNHRPHYHLILFNASPQCMAQSYMVAKKIWQKGSVDVASCNMATINYVVGYVMSGAWAPEHELDDRHPHFSLMSKGLGSNYLTDEIYDFHYDRMDTSVMHPSGFRIPLPRYYKDKIFSVEEKAELYEINQRVRQVDWEEFVNIDFEKQVEETRQKIRLHERKNKKVRNTL
jgi:hypothetical protein